MMPCVCVCVYVCVYIQWQRALRLLDLMWQCGGEMQPDIVSYNTVIKAAGNAQQVALGFQVRTQRHGSLCRFKACIAVCMAVCEQVAWSAA